MYDSTDPRSKLTPSAKPATPASTPGAFFGADYGRFYEEPPQESSALVRQWFVRGQNFVVAYAETGAGATSRRTSTWRSCRMRAALSRSLPRKGRSPASRRA